MARHLCHLFRRMEHLAGQTTVICQTLIRSISRVLLVLMARLEVKVALALLETLVPLE